MKNAKNRFVKLWQRHSFINSNLIAQQIFDDLIKLYSEDWREFHNMDHILVSIDYLDDCKIAANFADAIELAIWFHDCIYVLGASDNELRSREWFNDKSKGVLVPALVSQVEELIIDTTHDNVPESMDGKLIADIDLTSFGLPWDEYMQDSQAVQREITGPGLNIDELKITTDKINFLTNLISDGQVYYSDFYLQNFEQKAQQNVHRHLEILKSLT